MKSREGLEEELKIYKDRLEKAMGAGNLAWWEMELPSGEVVFNDRKAEMLGYSPDEFTHYEDFTDLLHPEDHDRTMKAMRDHLEGEEPRYEVEYRIEKKDGDYKWFRDVGGITEEDEEGEYKKVTGVVIDIDERKQAEEREEFLHSLLRHDVRNKLQIAKGYFELLEDFDLPEEGEEYIDKSEKSIDEAVNITQKVRKLRRIDQEEEIGELNLAMIIETVVDEHRDQLSEKGIDIERKNLEAEVMGGPLLEELFSNLMENSIRHSNCDLIKISAGEDNGEWIVTFEDNGKGIPDKHKENIFEKGHKMGETAGSGLGMFVVRRVAEVYGGTVEVKDSELGGARFDVRLKKA